jgi:hypothetical protein
MVITKKLLEVRDKRMEPDEVKPLNIVDMALGFSAMMRLFQEGSKEIIQKQIMVYLPRFFNAKSEDEFKAVHHAFCIWGTNTINTAEKKQKDGSIKNSEPTSYGQIAKTLDVVLHVVIHYAQYPNNETSENAFRMAEHCHGYQNDGIPGELLSRCLKTMAKDY